MNAQCQYRRTKSGEWVVMGPASVVQVGGVVQVTKKNGETKDETILSIGKPFLVDGVNMVYGHTGHGWQAQGPYQKKEGKRDGKTYGRDGDGRRVPQNGSGTPKRDEKDESGRDQTQTVECHVCAQQVDTERLGQAWCDGEAIGCSEHGGGDLCLACDDCRGEGEKE